MVGDGVHKKLSSLFLILLCNIVGKKSNVPSNYLVQWYDIIRVSDWGLGLCNHKKEIEWEVG